MNLVDYIADHQSKYAVIGSANYDADPVAQSISTSPRRFSKNETEYVILSLDPASIENLVGYISMSGSDVEYEFIQGSGKVSLLTHSQAIELLGNTEDE